MEEAEGIEPSRDRISDPGLVFETSWLPVTARFHMEESEGIEPSRPYLGAGITLPTCPLTTHATLHGATDRIRTYNRPVRSRELVQSSCSRMVLPTSLDLATSGLKAPCSAIELRKYVVEEAGLEPAHTCL